MNKFILLSAFIFLWGCAADNSGNSGALSPLKTPIEGPQINEASAPKTEVETANAFPYVFTAPESWRKEVVTFPLSFAPELDYEGHGDVRFAPGMFTEGADDFWTYSFVWWLPLDTEITPDQLSVDMNRYFSGLANLIMKMRELDTPDFIASAHFEKSDHLNTSPPGSMALQGHIQTLDAFTTQRPVALNANVDLISCAAQGHLAVIFGFSPQPFSHENWRVLNEIKAGFQCSAN